MTRLPLHRRFAVHTQPPAPSSDGDSKKSEMLDEEENEKVKKSSEPMANDDHSSSNPWRHFQAFSSMDEYMDVTLIHYKNNESKSEGVKKGSGEEAHKPHIASNAQPQTKD